MMPVYEKRAAKEHGKKRPGAKKGHPGSRRPKLLQVDREVDHRAECCPDCGGPLNLCAETRTRCIEEIPYVKPEVTEHTVHRDWCPACKKYLDRR